MTFLNPAILLGLAAASIPVIIHLLNLKKLKKIEFSTLSFLKELQKNKIRRVKLKQWLLLALRVLIILLIVSAFARPTLEGLNIGGTTSAAKTTAIVILDDTFSMSVITQKGSYFKQAEQLIKNAIQNLEEGDEAALLLVSGNEEHEIKLTSNIQSIITNMETIPLSGSSGTLNSALIRAADIIGESINFNKEIYLLTDFQLGRISADENIVDLGILLNSQLKLYSFNLSEREINNVSIDNLLVKTKIFETKKPVTFEATITNHSPNPVVNHVVSLFINSKRSAQKSIDLSAYESKNILLEGTVAKTGQSDILIEIEDDEIIEDNKRYVSLNIPDRYSVLLLYDDLNDANFVNLALRSSIADKSLNITLESADRINSVRTENFDVIISVSDKLNLADEELDRFINSGGGLVIYPSSSSRTEEFNIVLSKIKLPPSSELVEMNAESNSHIDFDMINNEHPLLQNIFKDEDKKKIESPAIYKYYKYSPGGKGKSIVTLIDGSSFLSEYNLGEGKILVYNVSPVTQWGDFPLKSIFAPLVYKSIVYLTSGDNVDADILAGESINFNISDRTSPSIKIVSPDNREEFINLNGKKSEFIRFSKTYHTGNYKLYSGDELLETVSVNTDPVESDVSYISDADFDDYLNKINFKGSHLRISKDENPAETILQARFGSELWRYFLIAAFLLALVEMTVSRAAKKELIEIDK